MKKLILLALMMFLASCNTGADEIESETAETSEEVVVEDDMSHNSMEGMDHGEEMSEDAVKKVLSDSPRHQEWVNIDNDGKNIRAFVVYPENNENSSAVVMIHENKWLNDWARSMADQIAAEWHIVVAPDLLSSFDEDRQQTSDFETPDDATEALYSLDQADIDSDLQAVADYAKGLDSFNGNLVSAGFCWGGTQSFQLSNNEDYKASLVFYGTTPEDESFYDDVKVPVYGFYAENDDRVNAGIEETNSQMEASSKSFEYEIYDGVGHAFMRQADVDLSDELAQEAKDAAFDRMTTILAEYK